jgi:hypothetical protein
MRIWYFLDDEGMKGNVLNHHPDLDHKAECGESLRPFLVGKEGGD